MHAVIKQALVSLGKEEHAWRIRLTASRTLTEPHAYNVWLGDSGEWYVIESTLDREGSYERAWRNTPIRHNNFYYDFFGFATVDQTWGGDMDAFEPHEVA
jgi:hypothetical protein